MLKPSALKQLQSGKNLLAFSAGGDSTALLFLLLKHKILFDIAIVDYGLRLQSKEEVKYAKDLAQKHNFNCYVHTASQIDSNFEANARAIRYDFFEGLIKEHKYDNLLTAHHLGDRFEWMLMQFCKGAGCVELSGMQEKEKRNDYTLVRPLLHLDKSELLAYLQKENIYYFEDKSNSDIKYKRNEFRLNHTKPLLEKHLQGIKKSFEYIDDDVSGMIKDVKLENIKEFAFFVSSQSKRSDIFHIDKYLKREGYLISANEKELLKSEKTVVIARKIVVNQEHGFVFIAPYIKSEKMDKDFKEAMRLLKIEPKLRGYLFTNTQAKELLVSLL
jgi:tRNA(Ile)-lysidine synthase